MCTEPTPSNRRVSATDVKQRSNIQSNCLSRVHSVRVVPDPRLDRQTSSQTPTKTWVQSQVVKTCFDHLVEGVLVARTVLTPHGTSLEPLVEDGLSGPLHLPPHPDRPPSPPSPKASATPKSTSHPTLTMLWKMAPLFCSLAPATPPQPTFGNQAHLGHPTPISSTTDGQSLITHQHRRPPAYCPPLST